MSTNSLTLPPMSGNQHVCLNSPIVRCGPWCPSCAKWMTSACSPAGMTSCVSLSAYSLTMIPSTIVRSLKTPLNRCKAGLHSPLPMSSMSCCRVGSFKVSLLIIFLVIASGSWSSSTQFQGSDLGLLKVTWVT